MSKFIAGLQKEAAKENVRRRGPTDEMLARAILARIIDDHTGCIAAELIHEVAKDRFGVEDMSIDRAERLMTHVGRKAQRLLALMRND